jgi:hypothetical protein
MGSKLNIQNNTNHRMLIATERLLNIATRRFYKVWLHPNIIFERTKQYITLKKDALYIREFACQMLDNIKNSGTLQSKEEEVDENNDDINEKKPISFMGQLMKLSEESDDAFTNEDVLGETITTLLAVIIKIFQS